MSEDPTKSVGDGAQLKVSDQAEEKVPDTVKHETYARVVSQKKKGDEQIAALSERLAKFEQDAREREESKLRENNEFQKLVELREKELKEVREKAQNLERRFEIGSKLDAFDRALGGKLVHKDYYGFVKVDQIVIDPSTGSIDEMSVAREVERFRTEHARLIEAGQSPKVPASYPQQVAGQMQPSQKDKMAFIAKHVFSANNKTPI